MDAVFSDLSVDAVKIGMLSQIPVIEAVADGLGRHSARNVIFDPVMVTTSGDPLLAEDAVSAIRNILLPIADLITPNLHEAAKLTDMAVAEDDAMMVEQANILLSSGGKSCAGKRRAWGQ